MRKKIATTYNPLRIISAVVISFLIVTAFTLNYIGVVNSISAQNNIMYRDTLYLTKIVYIDTLDRFSEAIKHLKEYEGFRSDLYYDVDGSRTIGYGHHLKSNEHYSSITEEQATRILIADLKSKIEYVEKHTDLRGNKSLALGLFAFNVGTGNLMTAINNGLLNNITKITDYCHYSIVENGVKITKRSDKLYERRKFELYLYNN